MIVGSYDGPLAVIVGNCGGLCPCGVFFSVLVDASHPRQLLVSHRHRHMANHIDLVVTADSLASCPE